MRTNGVRRSPLAGFLLVLVSVSANAQSAQGRLAEITWERGPVVGSLGSEATVRIADGCTFTGVDGTRKFLTLTQNPWSGDERGTALCRIVRQEADTAEWFAIFEYDASGYVKDDEKAELDADKILASMRKGNEASNKVRKDRGWPTLEFVGWEKPPFYDPATNNLTWAIRLRAEDGGESVNHSVRLLGRRGVMKVDLVVAPENYGESLTGFTALISDHEYNSGQKYAEWREGDKLAGYGLTALVAGGAGVMAAKTGLLGKLWKVIVAGVVALGAGLKKLFGGRKTENA